MRAHPASSTEPDRAATTAEAVDVERSTDARREDVIIWILSGHHAPSLCWPSSSSDRFAYWAR